MLNIAGLVASLIVGPWSRRSPIKGPNRGRMGLTWLILFGYGALWMTLLCPWEMAHRAGWQAYAALMDRKVMAFWSTVPMFGYVIMGLWLDRFCFGWGC